MEQLREEALKFIRVPKNLVFLILGPLVFTLLFGAVYVNDYLNDIPVAVYDQDHSGLSRMIRQTFDNSDRFVVTADPATEGAFKALVEAKAVHLGVFIPKGFEEDIARGRETGALLLVDGANIAIGNNALATAGEILNTLNGGITARVMTGKNASPEEALGLAQLFQFRGPVLFDAKLTYKTYVLPGLLTVLIQQLFLTVFVPGFIEDPVNPLRKGLVYIGAALLAYALCLLVLSRVFGLVFAGSLWIAVLLMGFYLLCLLGSAMTLGALLRNRLAATQVCMMLSMPTFLLAGYVWPAEQMPAALTVLVKLFWPLPYMVGPVRDLLVKGAPVSSFGGSLAGAAVFGIVWFFIGSWLTRRRLGVVKADEGIAPDATVQGVKAS